MENLKDSISEIISDEIHDFSISCMKFSLKERAQVGIVNEVMRRQVSSSVGDRIISRTVDLVYKFER